MNATEREQTHSLRLSGRDRSGTTSSDRSGGLRQRVHTARSQNVSIFDQTVDEMCGDNGAL